MLFQKMSEKYQKEMKVYIRIIYVLFFLTLLMMLLEAVFDLRVFDVLSEIGKDACMILGVVAVCRMAVTCEKVLEQHDILVDKLEEKGKEIERLKNQ